MFFDRPSKDLNLLEQLIDKQNRSTQELMLRIDALNREVNVLLEELQVTPEQISHHLANPDNFSPEHWEELQKQRQLLDEKLSRTLENVRDPIKTRKAQAERQIQNHWLFVR